MSFNPALPDVTDFLLRRRSVKAKTMSGPGPSKDQLETILKCALRVPDHGKLAPWKLIVLDEAGQADFAARIEAVYEREEDRAAPKDLTASYRCCPTLVIVASTMSDARPIPEIEQRLSAGALIQNLIIATHGLGFGANWLTGWPAYSAGVKAALGLRETDVIAGFVFLGTGEVTEERPRPDFRSVVQFGL